MQHSMCLNMIVRNESHLIKDTLEKLTKKIKFDYWCISDTGSTDGTQDIIRQFFALKGIKGELVEHEWRDFGYNRTKALESAHNKSDYLLVFDADDELCGDFTLPTNMNADGYKLNFGDANGISYSRVLILNNRKRWCYKGVLHEYIESLEPTCRYENHAGNYYIISGKKGARSLDTQKYYKDALVLERAHATALEEKDDLYIRYAFYCANSYNDCNRHADAIKWYKITLSQTNWVQEKYIACLRIYDCSVKLDKKEEGLYYLVESFKYDKKRVECVYNLVKHYSIEKSPDIAKMYYSVVKSWYETQFMTTVDFSNFLFISVPIYNFYLPYYMIIVCAQLNAYDDGFAHFRIIFKKKYTECGDWFINNLLHNFNLYIPTLVSNTWTPSDKIGFLSDILNYVECAKERNVNIKPEYIHVIHTLIEEMRPILTKIPNLYTNIKPCKKEGGVFLSITTCKRLDLFKQTINSILNTWTDLDKINCFFCVDDFSSEKDREYMQKTYPFFKFYLKKETDEKGHRSSMNIIWRKIKKLKPKYWIHLEDDWLFFKRDEYVSRGVSLLEQYKSNNIHQILFNRNYAETYDVGWTINGGELLTSGVLKHVKSDSITGPNCAYWPHYSFRPSIVDADIIMSLGNFNSPNNFFERDYADKYFAKGYMSAFFNGISSTHIGKLTSDKTGTNAYTLNDVSQFNSSNTLIESNKSNKQGHITPKKIINLLKRSDRREHITQLFNRHKIKDYEFVEATDGLAIELTYDIYNLFKGNDFGNRRGFIGCAISHLELWRQLIASTHSQYIIFEDDIQIEPEFSDKLDRLQKDITETTDILFLGSSTQLTNENKKRDALPSSSAMSSVSGPFVNATYIGGFFAYIITRAGATKMLDYISKNGIKHGIDYLVKIIPDLNCLSAQPHLVFSDMVYSGSANTDSNIQLDKSAFNFNAISNKNDWEFHPKMDMTGNDISFVGRKPIDEYIAHAFFTPECVAFNTLGFFKNKITDLSTSPYFGPNDGVYVKKQQGKTQGQQQQQHIRVRMTGNYWTSQQLCQEWSNLTKGNHTWNNIQFTWETNNIDYYIIINRPCNNDYYDPAKTIVFQMEPWCYNPAHNWGVKTWGEWAEPDESKFLQVRSHRNYYNNGFWQLRSSYTELTNAVNIEKYDHSIISTICSSKYFDEGHIKRIDFLKFIELKDDPLVSFHYYNHDNPFQFKNYMGLARPNIDKEVGIMKYKYYFMCENNAEHNFITEKLWEPILCNCLCFYWGCPNASDYIDPRAFVQLDMHDFEKSFALVKQAIAENWWQQRLPFIIQERKKILEYYAFCPTVERIINNDISNKSNKPSVDWMTDKTIKTACFIHSCNISLNGTSALDNLLVLLEQSLIKFDLIVVNNIGLTLDNKKYISNNKIKFIHCSDNNGLFERPTLTLMHSFSALNDDVKILYLHTKGISYNPNTQIYTNIQAWIAYMLHFLLDSKCLPLLDECDTLGCNYYEGPYKHYSGNFWWIQSKYLATLNLDRLVSRADAEWWCLSGKDVRMKELYRSNVNHFENAFLHF
jgi:GR25 family glycosyltransferase involved in LPS biosynthesis